jgi:NADH-quinone oxidoreductase subunit H
MAAAQRRVGPNVVGPFGLLQPLADGLKLAAKEYVTPTHAFQRIFVGAAIITLFLALLTWRTVPFGVLDYSTTMTIEMIYAI